MKPAGPTLLNTSLKSHPDGTHEQRVPPHEGSVMGDKHLVITTDKEIAGQPSGTPGNSSLEPRQQVNRLNENLTYRGSQIQLGQATEGWRSYTLFAPPTGPNKAAANSGSTALTSPPPPLPKPLTKEMAARKRTFAEIIDLTTDTVPASVEDHPLTASKIRRVGDTNFQSAEGYGGAQAPAAPSALKPHLEATTTPTPKLPSPHHPTPSTDTDVTPVINPFRDFKDIVKPIDRSVALRKSRYDPKTIARNILIATARHPFQRGLNAHLEQLQDRFTGIDDTADLSTFRWDIIDPGGPAAGSANLSPPPEKMEDKSATGADGSPLNKLGLKDVKLPIGRGPLRPTRGDSSLRGRRGSTLNQTQTRTPAQPSGLRYSSTVESNFAVVIESAARSTLPNPPNISSDTFDSSSAAPRRPGRPPKKLSPPSELVTPSSKRIGRPPKTLSSGVDTLGNSAGRKVGRPRTHPQSESKPRGRPRKSVDPKLVSPKFIPFLCEWKDCKAELHNLETLRKHIYTVHNKKQMSGAIVCQWAKCGLSREVRDKRTLQSKAIHENHDFADIQAFKDHVEKAHLIPFAWHMGDGPRGSTLGICNFQSDKAQYANMK
jgi:hypothetical protein